MAKLRGSVPGCQSSWLGRGREGFPLFRALRLRDFNQFGDLDITFDPKLTVLVGANASGKTTVLNLLSQSLGWNLPFLRTPKSKRSGGLSYVLGGRRRRRPEELQTQVVGELTYEGAESTTLMVPADDNAPAYGITAASAVQVPGFFLPAHRAVQLYRAVGQVALTPPTREALFQAFADEQRSRYQGGGGPGPFYRLKEALIALAIFAYGNQAVRESPEARTILEGYQRVLRRVLPDSLRFQRFEVLAPEVVLITGSGPFPLEAVSGGIASLMDLSWQLHMCSLLYERYAVLIDEPENHLHPALQRTYFPRLVATFEGAQFIAATHSPFIVGSVADSQVYALRPSGRGTIHSELLDPSDKAGSANEILRDVLGLPVTLPVWVEDRLDQIAEGVLSASLSSETLGRLRTDLIGLGMEHLFPEVLTRL